MTATQESTAVIPDFGDDDETDRKICFIASKGTLDMVYPSLVMANAALGEGIETHIFFTFWGLDIITKKHMDDLQFTWMGNTAMHPPGGGMHMPQGAAGLPGMTRLATRMMKKQIADLDVPEVPEFVQMISDAGGHLWACKMTVDMMGLTKEDMIDEVEDIISATDFIELSEGAQVIFT
ncbi:MAG: DsrE/DsrF/DrsH-like family protein [Acidimicrobiia bacterium]|nr:DsrE/DsrF/DrsH-like family protein [Acidimicrobiia bacterium]